MEGKSQRSVTVLFSRFTTASSFPPRMEQHAPSFLPSFLPAWSRRDNHGDDTDATDDEHREFARRVGNFICHRCSRVHSLVRGTAARPLCFGNLKFGKRRRRRSFLFGIKRRDGVWKRMARVKEC